jgi:hypothetical protein
VKAGMKLVRILTRAQKVTHVKKEAHARLNVRVLKQNATSKSASMAKQGEIQRAIQYGQRTLSFLEDVEDGAEDRGEVENFRGIFGEMRTTLEEEEDEEEVQKTSSEKRSRERDSSKPSSKSRSDKSAQMLYKMMSPRKK